MDQPSTGGYPPVQAQPYAPPPYSTIDTQQPSAPPPPYAYPGDAGFPNNQIYNGPYPNQPVYQGAPYQPNRGDCCCPCFNTCCIGYQACCAAWCCCSMGCWLCSMCNDGQCNCLNCGCPTDCAGEGICQLLCCLCQICFN